MMKSCEGRTGKDRVLVSNIENLDNASVKRVRYAQRGLTKLT